MKTPHTYQDYIRDIWVATLDIEEFITGKTYEEFKSNKMACYAVRSAITIIGEAAKKVPAFLRKKHPEVPWVELGDMRNKFIHEYFGVNLEVIWEMAAIRLPELKPHFAKVLEEAAKELFDRLDK